MFKYVWSPDFVYLEIHPGWGGQSYSMASALELELVLVSAVEGHPVAWWCRCGCGCAGLLELVLIGSALTRARLAGSRM